MADRFLGCGHEYNPDLRDGDDDYLAKTIYPASVLGLLSLGSTAFLRCFLGNALFPLWQA
jgi:hypothetical protein